MAYPPATYHGDPGEVSATHPPDIRWEAEGRANDAAVEAFFRLHDNQWV